MFTPMKDTPVLKKLGVLREIFVKNTMDAMNPNFHLIMMN